MSWIFYSLLSPALYNVSNFIDRFLVEKYIRDPLALSVIGGIVTFFTGLFVFVLLNFPAMSKSDMFFVLGGGAILELALLPYYKAIQLDDVSRIVPVYQVVPVFVIVLSYLFLGERLTLLQSLGSAAVIFGSYIISLKDFSGGILNLRMASWYILLSSIMFSSAMVVFKFILGSYDFWTVLSYEFMGGGIGVLIILSVKSYRHRFLQEIQNVKRAYRVILINEVDYVLARVVGFFPISLAPVSLVMVLGGLGPFFSLLMGLGLSKWYPEIIAEDINRDTLLVKLICILIIFFGIYLISTS